MIKGSNPFAPTNIDRTKADNFTSDFVRSLFLKRRLTFKKDCGIIWMSRVENEGDQLMYIFEDMIEMGLEEGQEWSSEIHRIIAVEVCIQNPRITSLELLINNVRIINSIPVNEIRKVTFTNLSELGCVF